MNNTMDSIFYRIIGFLKKSNYKLLIIFLFILIFKVYFSFTILSPWVLPDETLYDYKAFLIYEKGEFFGSNLDLVDDILPGYPFVISLAYHLFTEKTMIFHTMLIVNCILTTLTIFPAYLILSHFISKDEAIWGSIIICTLPSINNYSNLLMSENLFSILYLFSILFILKTIISEKIIWSLLFSSSIIALIFTRIIGISILFSTVITIIIYLIYLFLNYKSFEPDKNERLKIFSLIFPLMVCLPILVHIFFQLIISRQPFYEITPSSYSNPVIEQLSNIDSIFQYISLLLNEVGLIILVSYFIFLFSLMILTLNILSSKYVISCEINRFLTKLNANYKNGLVFTSVYILISTLGIISISLIHMNFMITSAIDQPSMNYLVFGRLLDPIIPGLFLIGFISLSKITNNNSIKIIKSYILFLIITNIYLYLIFPYYSINNFENNSIWYIHILNKLGINIQIFVCILSIICLLFLIISMKQRELKKLLYIFIIVLSIITICVQYHEQIYGSNYNYNYHGDLGNYIINNFNDKSTFAFEIKEGILPIHRYLLTKFWINNKMEISIQNFDHIEKESFNGLITNSRTKQLYSEKPIFCDNENFCLYI